MNSSVATKTRSVEEGFTGRASPALLLLSLLLLQPLLLFLFLHLLTLTGEQSVYEITCRIQLVVAIIYYIGTILTG